MFKEKGKGERCLDTRRFGRAASREARVDVFWVPMDLAVWLSKRHTRTHEEKLIQWCKFKLIKRDHVGFIKSTKSKAKRFNHWENRHS